jgi:2Fe-2S ferredoxin
MSKNAMMSAMPRVKIRMTHAQKIEEIDAPKKSNLLKLLQSKGISVGSACGGMGICASCKVTVIQGASHLSPPNEIEEDLAERNNLQRNERISCQTEVLGDIEITTGYW